MEAKVIKGDTMNEGNVYKLYLPLLLRIMLIFMLVFFAGISIFLTIFPFVFKGQSAPPAGFGFFWVAIVAWNTFWVLRIPHTIVLRDDASVEFISVTRQVKVHAMQVKSIKPEAGALGFLVAELIRK